MRLISGILAAGLGAAALSATSAREDGPVTLHTGASERLCLETAPPEGRRPVLAIHAVTGEVGAIAVAAETGETALIGLFPGGPFKAETPGEVRRSFLPGEAARCWRFALEGEGTAEIAVELSEPLGKGLE